MDGHPTPGDADARIGRLEEQVLALQRALAHVVNAAANMQAVTVTYDGAEANKLATKSLVEALRLAERFADADAVEKRFGGDDA